MADEEADAAFVSQLDEASKKKAKDELNERNEKDTILAVQTLRKWVHEQDWLKTPTDFGYLLRYLRYRKFSQLEARKALQNYWTVKSKRPEWSKNVDPTDPAMIEMMRKGFLCSPLKRDKNNRRVVLFTFGGFDMEYLNRVGIDFIYKYSLLFYDWLVCDENVQCNGISFFADYSNVSMRVVTAMSGPDKVNDFFTLFQHSFPVRIKSINVYNEPAFYDLVNALYSPFMSSKMKERLHLRSNSMVKIFEEIGYECLPSEYLPDDYSGPNVGSQKEVIEAMIADMSRPEFLSYIRDLSSDKYQVDKSKIPAKTEEVASYRKINTE